MIDDYGLVSMKPKATANIAAGNTSDDRDIDGVADEDDDECLLLHKTMADFGLNVNPFVLSECPIEYCELTLGVCTSHVSSFSKVGQSLKTTRSSSEPTFITTR